MKTWHTLWTLALCSALALFSIGCDDDSGYDAENGSGASGEVSDNGEGIDAAEDAADEGPIPEEQFEQLKEQWVLQIDGAAESAKTLSKINEEHKDEQLATMLDEINAKITAIRENLDKATPQNGRQMLTVDIPKGMGEVSEMQNKAMERMQEVVKSKIPGG